jgi:acid phosphatase (class A)
VKPEAVVFAGLCFALAACASGIAPITAAAPAPYVDATMAPRDPAARSGERLTGFLTPETTPDATAIIPPAPTEGEARNDWAIFRQTRVLEGTARWELAVNDDNYEPAAILKDFSCAVGVELTVENSPTLSRLLSRAATDSANAAASAKATYKRTRPFLHNEGNICIARSEGLMKSFDYPSGHASASWVEGLILAELAPDRSAQVLARARAYGESRVVCGVHNYSAVQAGRTNASGVFAALHGSADFRDQMDKALAELAVARRDGRNPDAAMCASEADLTRPLSVN